MDDRTYNMIGRVCKPGERPVATVTHQNTVHVSWFGRYAAVIESVENEPNRLRAAVYEDYALHEPTLICIIGRMGSKDQGEWEAKDLHKAIVAAEAAAEGALALAQANGERTYGRTPI